jgi:hypothetical protein
VSVGGATWDAAGTLDAGINTFDFADVTEVGIDRPFNHGWWTYTPSVDTDVTVDSTGTVMGSPDITNVVMVAYTGATEGAKVEVASNVTVLNGVITFTAAAGVTHHILVGTYHSTGDTVTQYVLDVTEVDASGPPPTPTVQHRTGWQTGLRDDDRNWLIVSRGNLTLDNIDTNEFNTQDWYQDVIVPSTVSRRGDYTANEVLGGFDPISAESCVIDHARFGDEDAQYWNTTTTEIDDTGEPVCRPLLPGAAIEHTDTGQPVSHASEYGNSDLFVNAHFSATVMSRAHGVWLKPIFDHLTQRGVLPDPDPSADGSGVPVAYQPFATLEWEGDLELVAVQLGVDDVPPDLSYPDPTSLPETSLLAVDVNPTVRPSYAAGAWGGWPKGFPPGVPPEEPELMADGSTPKPFLTYYEPGDGSPGWTTYDNLDDTAKLFDPATEEPDIVVTTWTSGAHDGWSGTDVSESNPYGVAVKVTLRSPRYRWVWEAPATPVTRQHPRDDGRGLSAGPRLYPASKAQRIYGGHR